MTETHPADSATIWDNLDITDFGVITDITDFPLFFTFFDIFEDEIGLAALIIRCADYGSLMRT